MFNDCLPVSQFDFSCPLLLHKPSRTQVLPTDAISLGAVDQPSKHRIYSTDDSDMLFEEVRGCPSST